MTHISARGRWLPWVTPWVMAVMSGLLVFFAQMGPSTVGAGPALAAPTTTFGKASHVYDCATQQLSDTPGATNPQDRSSRSSAARAPWEIWVVRHKPVSSGAAEDGEGLFASRLRAMRADPDRGLIGDGTPRTNIAQNKQFNDAIKAAERQLGRTLSKDERSAVHREISGQDYGYHDIADEVLGMFGGGG